MNHILILVFLLVFNDCITAQQIKISREINVKNDVAYDILPNIGENTIFYREKTDEYFFDMFTNDLEFKRSQEIFFDRKKVNILHIVPHDTCINIVYSYKFLDTFYIKVKKFDSTANSIDTTLVYATDESSDIPYGMKTQLSEDKSKILIFGRIKKKFACIVFDFTTNTLFNHEVQEFTKVDINEDFRKILVTNQGHIYTLFEKNNDSYEKERHKIIVYRSSGRGNSTIHYINSPNMLNTGLVFGYHNASNLLTIAGLAGKEENTATSYFVHQKFGLSIPENDTLKYYAFDENLPAEIYPNGKQKKLIDFEMKSLHFRKDGGVLLFAELVKSFYRRPSFPSRFDTDNYATSRGFTDHYNEDMIVFNVNPDGSLLWRNVLYKKQYSQDDEGVFSSYFLFHTPSRLRLVYNDEIKNSNTVSEYEIDPMGNYQRNTVLNTDYQNLKLRFTSAVQTGSNEFIVPSEKTSKINLVKIYY